ncbi:MAG: hypothetical protein V4515_13760 [Chloroflexota bacterium]
MSEAAKAAKPLTAIAAAPETDVLYYRYNLETLPKHVPDGSVDLGYLDPPFNSNRDDNVILKDESGRKNERPAAGLRGHLAPDRVPSCDAR